VDPSTRRRSLAVALAAALLVGLSATRCARQASVTPASRPSEVSTATTPAASEPSKATSASTVSTPAVDDAGAAIGSSLTVGSAKSGPKSGLPRPSNAAAITAAERLLHQTGDIGTVKSARVLGMTVDSQGAWWVLVEITDDLAGTDQAVLTYDGKKWDVMVFGEGVSNDDLPPDVRF
jgi:hypothetical protein